jgi:dihydropteroate synthase
MTATRNPTDRRPRVMGVLNVTPDSFSDGGDYLDTARAVERGVAMVRQGADIIDVGGESTRPGSRPVSAGEEMERILPVIEALKKRTDVLISVDTVKPEVAREALSLGAGMLNDVSNLRDGDGMAELAAKSGAELVLMHSRGTPETMGEMVEYAEIVSDVKGELMASVSRAEAAGVSSRQIWIDPGIGFAKRADQSLALIARLGELVALGYPVLVGPSRKSFINEVIPSPPTARIGGTAAAVAASILNGAAGVRVHDIEIMHQAAMIAHAIGSKSIRDGSGVHDV